MDQKQWNVQITYKIARSCKRLGFFLCPLRALICKDGKLYKIASDFNAPIKEVI